LTSTATVIAIFSFIEKHILDRQSQPKGQEILLSRVAEALQDPLSVAYTSEVGFGVDGKGMNSWVKSSHVKVGKMS